MNSKLLVLFLFIVASLGCDDTSTDPSTVRPTITGVVQLFDSKAHRSLDDHSGVRVSLVGTNIQATSDANGKWSLVDVPPGVYTILLSKSGYGSTSFYERQYSGVGVLFFDTITLWSEVGNEVIQLDEPSIATLDSTYMRYTTRDSTITWIDTIYRHDSAQGKLDTIYRTRSETFSVTDSQRVTTLDTFYTIRGRFDLEYRPETYLHIWPEYTLDGETGFFLHGSTARWNGSEFTYVFRKADVRRWFSADKNPLFVWVSARLKNGQKAASPAKTLPWP